IFRTSHMLSLPSVNFNTLMSKWSFAVYTLLRFISQAVILTLIAGLLASLGLYFETSHLINMMNVFQRVVTNPIYQIILIGLIYVNGKTVLYRLDDKEV